MSEELYQNNISQEKMDFFQVKELLQKIDLIAEDDSEKAISDLKELSEKVIGFLSDMSPTISETYLHICQYLSNKKIMSSWDEFPPKWRQIFLKQVDKIIEIHPDMTPFLFSRILRDYRNADENNKNSFLTSMVKLLCCAESNLAVILLEKGLNEDEKLKKSLMGAWGKLYINNINLRSCIEEKVFNFHPQNADELSILFTALSSIAETDQTKCVQILQIIDKYIQDKNNDTASLNAAYTALGKIREVETDKSKVDEVLLKGLQSSSNTKTSKKNAYRIMNNFEELYSTISLGERIEKSEDNVHGWRPIAQISGTETCVLYLGGDGTKTEKAANGYLKSVEELLNKNNLEDKVKLYSVVYDFGAFEDRDFVFNERIARRKLMEDYKRGVRKSRETTKVKWGEEIYKQAIKFEDNINPRYIKQIFDRVFLPRLTDEKGQRLSLDEASSRIRKLNIAAHCHGAYTFIKLEEMMQQKMAELGYTKEERADIQKELLCVAHNPYAPLGVSKSTMISFCSARDGEINHQNNFQMQVQHFAMKDQLPLSYFEGKKGNVFICSRLSEKPGEIDEHNFAGYDDTLKGLTPEGQALLKFENHALVSGVQNALEGKKLPSVEALVCGDNPKAFALFMRATENGTNVWNRIVRIARSKNMFEID